MKLEFPGIRERLVALLEVFADVQLQREQWSIAATKSVSWNPFDDAVNDVFGIMEDGSEGVPDPANSIGRGLYDNLEADAVREVLATLFGIISGLGKDCTYEEAAAHPAWAALMTSASNTRAQLVQRESR
jgi:hypothetical protein